MAGGAALGLGHAVVLLAAAVVAVPLLRRLGLGSVLGYLAAGLLLGPSGLRVVRDPHAIVHVAELGVVMLLFLIGLETRPARLWRLRGEIFGLGLAQVAVSGALLTGLACLAGLAWPVALVGAMGFVLSSTAVIMQTLNERGLTATPAGQRAVSILLLEDLSIVPLLVVVGLLATAAGGAPAGARPAWVAAGMAVVAVGGVLLAGRFALNPLFAGLARAGAREVMAAGALLVVLGTAWLMQWAGLSMAMGAFLAGVLLSGSTFRHQLEADVEPFRGILLGLFFLGVGMSLDLGVVRAQWAAVAAGVLSFMAGKAGATYAVARVFGADRREALERAALFAQGGEFAFVLYAAALGAGLFDARLGAVLTAVVILSMVLTPLLVAALRRWLPAPAVSLDGVDAPADLRGRVLMVGFGRFAQVVSQPLLAHGVEVAIIDQDVDMIRAAGTFGFKVYYGDGTRLDVLRAAGAGHAQAIAVCVDQPAAADRIAALVRAEFAHARLLVRAYDRGHALRLIAAGVDFELRETFESALVFGRAVLTQLGVDAEQADALIADTRERDAQRMALQITGGLRSGQALMRGNLPTPVPAPLVVPRHDGQALSDATASVLADGPSGTDGDR